MQDPGIETVGHIKSIGSDPALKQSNKLWEKERSYVC